LDCVDALYLRVDVYDYDILASFASL